MLQFELNLTILNNSTLKRVEFIGNKKVKFFDYFTKHKILI